MKTLKEQRQIDEIQEKLKAECGSMLLLQHILKELDYETKERVFKNIMNDWGIKL